MRFRARRRLVQEHVCEDALTTVELIRAHLPHSRGRLVWRRGWWRCGAAACNAPLLREEPIPEEPQ